MSGHIPIPITFTSDHPGTIPDVVIGGSSPRLLLDMVHHNPGEEPQPTRFLDPAALAGLSFNGQVFKHLNCAIHFESIYPDLFPTGSPAGEWIKRTRERIRSEIDAAHAAGLRVFYHIDLFVLPTALVERERDGICNAEGRISVMRERTLELHRVLFEEMFQDFPDVEGLIIRTGETYLLDTPFHAGNGPVRLHGGSGFSREQEQERFVRLIDFLREEICEKHDRWLLYRTWDTCPDRFHANPAYYREVTERVAPHPKLLFSMKHTALDFFRRVPFNGALGSGCHRQVVEVQCQREYEGKGAHPNYVMDGVINGFEEDPQGRGLRDLASHPLYAGLFTWSRGGGWYGPYLRNEFWCELNARVLAQWAADPAQSEEDVFFKIAERVGIAQQSTADFRRLCLLSATAVLKGRYCAVRDLSLCWMRDENIGGLEQLEEDFLYLDANNLFEEALAEKAEAVEIWEEIELLAEKIVASDPALAEYIRISTRYGRLLYSIVHAGWNIMVDGWRRDRGQKCDPVAILNSLARYDSLWQEFDELAARHPACATLYQRNYWSWPGTPASPGLDSTVRRFRSVVSGPAVEEMAIG